MSGDCSISSAHRGHILQERGHKTEQRILEQSKWTPEDRAAVVVQKIWRGYSNRTSYLTNPSYSVYKHLCASRDLGANMPKAGAGKTPVHLPVEAPSIVLKRSGREAAIGRFEQMQKVRCILKSQGSSHLTIPKAALCGDFLVEKRLPISSDDYINMGRYIDHPGAFDAAIRELTGLFSKVGISDIVVRDTCFPITNIVGDLVRYDNLPLYVEDGVGKIGLIDLEGVFDRPLSEFPDRTDELLILARIFPYHIEIILNEAKKRGMGFDESAVRSRAEQGCKFLKQGYTDHLQWLRQREITSQNAKQVFFEVHPSRMDEIIGIAVQKLQSAERPPELIAKSVRDIVARAKWILNEDGLGLRTHKVATDAEMVSYRSVAFSRKSLQRPKMYDENWNVIETEENSWDKWGYLDRDQLCMCIFSELVRGGELYFYDLNPASGGHEKNWIRY